jgi:hypothetical protein
VREREREKGKTRKEEMEKPLFVARADFYGVKFPQWLLSSYKHDIPDQSLGKDEQKLLSGPPQPNSTGNTTPPSTPVPTATVNVSFTFMVSDHGQSSSQSCLSPGCCDLLRPGFS